MNENNSIIPFVYEDRPVRVIMDEKNDPWWVAKDICNVLGLSSPTHALRMLDDDEKQTLPILPNTLKQFQGIRDIPAKRGNPIINIVNEAGLYTLIIRTDKPQARTFRRWITHEVLPSIRKTGSYATLLPEKENDGAKAVDRQIPEHIWQKIRSAGQSVRPGNRLKLLHMACQMNRLDQTVSATRAGVLLDYAELCSNIMMCPDTPRDKLDDSIGDFIDQCCFQEKLAKVQATDIYNRFVVWYHETLGDETPTNSWFGRQLAQRFSKNKSQGVVMYYGIGLLEEELEDVAP